MSQQHITEGVQWVFLSLSFLHLDDFIQVFLGLVNSHLKKTPQFKIIVFTYLLIEF